MIPLPDITSIGSFLSYICVINLLSLSLCTPAVLLLDVDKYFIRWFPFSSRQLSLCQKRLEYGNAQSGSGTVNVFKSHNINHNIYLMYFYTTIPYLHMFRSLLQIHYCALTSTILNGRTLSACIMQHKNPYSKQLRWVSSTIPCGSVNEGSYHISVSSRN